MTEAVVVVEAQAEQYEDYNGRGNLCIWWVGSFVIERDGRTWIHDCEHAHYSEAAALACAKRRLKEWSK